MTTTRHTSKKIGPVEITDDNGFVTIVTKRLRLLSLNQMDKTDLVEKYSQLLSNPKNISLYGEGKPWSALAVEEYVTTGVQSWNAGEAFGVFAVFTRDTQEFIGSLSTHSALNEFVGHPNAAEIGYVLDNRFWGRGFGTEIAIASKKHIKQAIITRHQKGEEEVTQEIVATVHPDNIPSKTILSKILKKQAEGTLFKFGGQPRLLFFKPLKQDNTVCETNCSPVL